MCTKMFRCLLLLALFMLANLENTYSFPDDSDYGYHGEERDALFALRDSLNSTFLKENWKGLMCYMNNPPKWYGIRCSNGRVTGIVLDGLGLSGTIIEDAFVNLTQLSVISFKNNLISGIMMDFSSNPKLSFIDLSLNSFQGHIHQSLTALPNLTLLHLNDNHITGYLPALWQTSLKYFNVSFNDLRGPVPDTKALQSFRYNSYLGNPKLCGPPTENPCSSKIAGPPPDPLKSSAGEDDEGTRKKLNFTTIFIIVDAALLLLVLLIVFLFCKKRTGCHNQNPASIKQDNISTETESIQTPHEKAELKSKDNLTFINDDPQFVLRDLLKSSAEGLSTGNFGNTYKALLQNGSAFVVKRLRDLKPMSIQELEKQVRLISDLQHPNILPLIAFYTSRDEKLLIYKHIPNGNLFNRIHGKKNKYRPPFRWNSRLSVAVGVAKAIEHLHINKPPQSIIPHGNLKTTNILLNTDITPLVTDYGLTALISTTVASQRMIAYKSPEYQSVKKLTNKADVWCLGVVLMELLTGRVSIYSAAVGTDGVDLCRWVNRAVREEWTAEIFDREIAVQRSAASGMLRVLKIAMRCCEKAPDKRPDIGEVVRELERLQTAGREEDDDGDVSDGVSDRSLTDESYSTTGSGV